MDSSAAAKSLRRARRWAEEAKRRPNVRSKSQEGCTVC